MVSSVAACCAWPSYGTRPTMYCQWGWLGSFSFFVPGDLDLWTWARFFTMYLTAKLDCPTFSRSEVMRTNWQTNKHTDKPTDTTENIHRAPLCYTGGQIHTVTHCSNSQSKQVSKRKRRWIAADTYVTVTMFLGLYESCSRKMTLSTKWSIRGSSFGPRTYTIHLWVDGSFTSFLLATRYLAINQTGTNQPGTWQSTKQVPTNQVPDNDELV